MNGRATNLNTAKPATARIKKIQRTSLPFQVTDLILKEKKGRLQTISTENRMTIPKQSKGFSTGWPRTPICQNANGSDAMKMAIGGVGRPIKEIV